MSAGRMAAQRLRRSHRGDTGAEASAGDNAGHADARPTVTVHVPLSFRQRRGRKVLVAPDGLGQEPSRAPQVPTHTREEVTPAVRALARAFRWRKLLETGAVVTVQEIAATENINPSYVSRVFRLTLLAPEIVEAVMEVGDAATLDRLMIPFPVDWSRHPSLRN
ncbi:hypothetical protein SAMN02982931_04802 [Bauldia litoralis]|uniref:Bacteriophage-related protein n=1 Tax=Bauldia litoralis TaxID=665467 RepID=A0A1G6EQ27_9HYPH|nr:hypothetical protein SAMN02982931_04802 [Bauldia litoralis]